MFKDNNAVTENNKNELSLLIDDGKKNSKRNSQTLNYVDTHVECMNKRQLLFWMAVSVGTGIAAWNYNSNIGLRNNQFLENQPFPEDFIWGSATSSYQIEGAVQEDGRIPSIWDTFCHMDDGKHCNGDTGDVACDHYHRLEEDVHLMKEMGIKAYRFSIAWSRLIIFPVNNSSKTRTLETLTVNKLGVDFYNTLIDTLLLNGIEPWVTLFHWDLPQHLADQYDGWLSPRDGGDDIVKDFGMYANICFQTFGDRVKKWITINESWTIAVNGYGEGIHAPGRHGKQYIAGHNLLLAHSNAVKIYRNGFQQKQRGLIGISNCGDYRYPQNITNKADMKAAQRAMEFQLAWFADPIWKGDYPQVMKDRLGERLPQFTKAQKSDLLGSSDFFGLNHYSSLLASEPLSLPSWSGYWADIFVNFTKRPNWETNCMGWSIVPIGCRDLLRWISNRYDNPPIYMTENGSCEEEPDLDSALEDSKRQKYLEGYIKACAEAIQDLKVDLRGYFAWSLMDNFEWQFGFSKRFGLHRVEFEKDGGDLTRTPKMSAKWYKKLIQQNGKNIFQQSHSTHN